MSGIDLGGAAPGDPRDSTIGAPRFPVQLWLLLREPRVVTAAQSIVWVILALSGWAALASPPPQLAGEAGPVLTLAWGLLLALGALAGLIGCVPGWWWVERLGIIATTTGALMYAAVLATMHVIGSGSQLAPAGLTLALIATLWVRWLRIAGPALDPTRGPDPRA